MGNVISRAELKQKTFKRVKVTTYDVSLWRQAGGYNPSALLNYILAKTKGKPDTHVCMQELAQMMDCTTDNVYNWTLKLQKNKLIDTYVTTEQIEGGKVRRFRFFTVNIEYLNTFKEGQAFLARFFRHTVKKAAKTAKKLFTKKEKNVSIIDAEPSVDNGSDVSHHSTTNEKNVTYSSNKLLNISYLKIRSGTAEELPSADASPSAPAVNNPADAGKSFKGEGKEEVGCNNDRVLETNIAIAEPIRGSVPLLEGEVVEFDLEALESAVRASVGEKLSDGRTRLPVDVDLVGHYRAAIEHSGIHRDHYERVWEDFCFYWHEEAQGKKAYKKNWYRTWINWLRSGITTQNKALYKPLSKEQKEEERQFYENLYQQEGIPELFSHSLGMAMFFGRQKQRQLLSITFGNLNPSSYITTIESPHGKAVFKKLTETDEVLAENLYKSWFSKCHYAEETCRNGDPIVVIYAPSNFIKAEIEKRFRDLMEELNMMVALKK